MQTLPGSGNTFSDCHLQIRRGKTTIFTDVAETHTVGGLKQILGHILRVNPDLVQVKCKGQILDTDGKTMAECGITKEARPQTPFQLEYIVLSDNGPSDADEVVPYSCENSTTAHDPMASGIPIDSR
jgi:hypothetical protein